MLYSRLLYLRTLFTNSMRHVYCYLLASILGIYYLVAAPITAVRDSLLNIADNTTEDALRISVYRNLADLYFEKPEETSYLKELYHTAELTSNKEEMFKALTDLTFAYIKNHQGDSAQYYMKVIEQAGKPEETLSYLSYLRMRLFEEKNRSNKGNEALQEEVNFLNNNAIPKDNIYIQIEKAYVTGYGLHNQNKYEEAYPYLETAYKLVHQLPHKEGEMFRVFMTWSYLNVLNFLDRGDQFIEGVEKLLDQYKKDYKQYYASMRPYYNINIRYLQCYTALLMRVDLLPEDKINYYICKVKEMSSRVTEDIDKYNCFLSMNNYYLHKEDYVNALATNDSLIKYSRTVGRANIPGLLDVNSQIYEAMGNYQKAYKYYKASVQARDSLTSSAMQRQLNELQVKYEIDKLNYENSRLANKNKLILLITLSSVLLLTIGACVYLYYDLKRERRMKKKLSELNEKAGESEKMKTAFINSMCHEIRTPLNAIVGFSGILTDETISLDEAMKKEYYDLITGNAGILTSLIDHLLVIANLDSSDELLSCAQTNIKEICRQEMGKLERQRKPGITYRLELPEEEIVISTNEQYLSLVIENLLNNANKFTEEGTISLTIWLNKAQGQLQISVADTGCGIPSEKREVVFERFTKLDEFVQGNGLGLYLSRLIVKRLSGSIFVDPNYTDGARIVIYLPV